MYTMQGNNTWPMIWRSLLKMFRNQTCLVTTQITHKQKKNGQKRINYMYLRYRCLSTHMSITTTNCNVLTYQGWIYFQWTDGSSRSQPRLIMPANQQNPRDYCFSIVAESQHNTNNVDSEASGELEKSLGEAPATPVVPESTNWNQEWSLIMSRMYMIWPSTPHL